MKAIGFIGLSGSGKTTLIERLIPVLSQRGLSVSALKHARHGFDLDRPGKDSFRFRTAGARQVIVAAPERWALMTELRDRVLTIDQLLGELAACDLVLVEGFRSEGSFPRIEVRASAAGRLPAEARLPSEARSAKAGSANGDANLIAVVCDDRIEEAWPRFARDEVPAIAAFIVERLGLER